MIAAVIDGEQINESSAYNDNILLFLFGRISSLMDHAKAAGKPAFVHPDPTHGLSCKEISDDVMKAFTRADAVNSPVPSSSTVPNPSLR